MTQEETINTKRGVACFTKWTDADSWLDDELKNIDKENIIERRIERDENCVDVSNTAIYVYKI